MRDYIQVTSKKSEFSLTAGKLQLRSGKMVDHIAEQEADNMAACIHTMHECGIHLDEPDKDCLSMECRFVCPLISDEEREKVV
jgi:hypothetical protein